MNRLRRSLYLSLRAHGTPILPVAIHTNWKSTPLSFLISLNNLLPPSSQLRCLPGDKLQKTTVPAWKVFCSSVVRPLEKLLKLLPASLLRPLSYHQIASLRGVGSQAGRIRLLLLFSDPIESLIDFLIVFILFKSHKPMICIRPRTPTVLLLNLIIWWVLCYLCCLYFCEI